MSIICSFLVKVCNIVTSWYRAIKESAKKNANNDDFDVNNFYTMLD